MEITLAPALDFMPIQITVLNRELRVGNRFRPAIQVVYQYSDWISVDGSWLWCKAAATNPKETFEIAVAHDVSRYSLDNRECYLSHYGLSEPPFCKSIAKANWYYWLLLPIAICFMFLGYRILCAQTLMRK
jgi:hypothetical protein